MAENLFDHIVYSRNVIEFVTVAKEYCIFIESHSAHTRKDFLEKVQKLLPLLYLKVTLLPGFEDEYAEIPEKFVTEVDYSYLLNKLSGKLAEYDSYQDVFDPGMQFSESAIGSTISENLCDIYQDLKDFVMVFRFGTIEVMAGALWEVQNNFKTYWGQKLVNVLRAIHALLYSVGEVDEDTFFNHREEKKYDHENWLAKHFDSHAGEVENQNDEV